MQIVMTPELLLSAYMQGLFPMAESGNSPYVQWICPQMRGQLSIENMHVPRRLAKSVRGMKLGGKPYEIYIDRDFRGVIEACAEIEESRNETWINQKIIDAYCKLNEIGYAHSVECYQDGKLVGGLYGVSIGGVFCGESMFSRARDASKVALVHLVARLCRAGYQILDTQFINDHLEQFGVYEIPHEEYMEMLKSALDLECDFTSGDMSERNLVRAYLT